MRCQCAIVNNGCKSIQIARKVLQRQKSLPFVYKAMLGATSQLRNACHPFMACNLLITEWQGTLIQDGPPREDGGREEQC